MYTKEVKLWNAGYCKYIDHMGDDLRPLVSARMSTLNPTGVDKTKDDGLRDYLWRHRHTSVFEQCELVVEVQVPIFIARQIVRHRTFQLNEFSMRYSEPLHEYYVPAPDYISIDDKHNKQGSGENADEQTVSDFINDSLSDVILNKARYDKYRDLGVAKERVRDFQPVSAYTRMMLKCNLRNWFHFLELRLKPGAQREIRDVANAIYAIIKDLFPLCAETFEENTLDAVTFSKTEMEVLKAMITGDLEYYEIEEYSGGLLIGSRLREFKAKLGRM